MLWRLRGQCPLPVYRGARNFAQSFLIVYICHLWRPNSYRFHSGIKNVLQDSLEDALENHRSISSSSARRGLIFCMDLPQYLYLAFLTSINIKPFLRDQECPPKLLGGNFGKYPPSVDLEAWKCAQSSFILYLILDVQSYLDLIQESWNVLQDFFVLTLWRLIGEYFLHLLPKGLCKTTLRTQSKIGLLDEKISIS